MSAHQTRHSQVLGGPAQYDGRDLRAAHTRLAIDSHDFERVVGHLVAALQEAGAPADVIARVGDELAGAKKDIVASVR